MADNRISILLNATLNKTSAKEIQKELEMIAKNTKFEIKVSEDGMKNITKSTKEQLSSIDKLISRYKSMKITYEELDKYGTKVIKSERFKTKSLQEQAKVYDKLKAVEQQRTKNLVETDKINENIAKKQLERLQQLKNAQNATQQKQQTLANQYAPINGDRNINLASMERYNNFIKSQNEAYKAGRISAEQYMQITNRIIDQTSKYQQADNKLVANMVSNRKTILNTEQKLADQIANARQKNIDLAHQEALKMNALFDKQKQREIQETRKAEEAKLNEIRKAQQARERLERQTEERWLRNLHNQRQAELQRLERERISNIRQQTISANASASFANSQTSLQNRINSLQSGNLSRYTNIQEVTQLQTRLNELSNTFSRLGTTTPQYRQQMAGLNEEFRKIRTNASEASRSVGYEFGNMLETGIKKMAVWTLTATLMYQPLRQLQDGIKYIYDLDNALNQIRIVTSRSQADVEKLAESYNKLARQMGVTTKEIALTSVDLFRQGLPEEEVNKRMDAIIKYAKISGISLAESNKIITATSNAMGVSAEKAVDVMSYLGDVSASGKYLCPAA
jgi:hypothetical protein